MKTLAEVREMVDEEAKARGVQISESIADLWAGMLHKMAQGMLEMLERPLPQSNGEFEHSLKRQVAASAQCEPQEVRVYRKLGDDYVQIDFPLRKAVPETRSPYEQVAAKIFSAGPESTPKHLRATELYGNPDPEALARYCAIDAKNAGALLEKLRQAHPDAVVHDSVTVEIPESIVAEFDIHLGGNKMCECGASAIGFQEAGPAHARYCPLFRKDL